MNTEAIERIEGYCCKVTQEQWDELVRVADEVGVKVGNASRAHGVTDSDKFARYNKAIEILGVYDHKYDSRETIPFPEFLAKLRGYEQWQPKVGEMVEVKFLDGEWYEREFILTRDGKHLCWHNTYNKASCFDEIRPLRSTITRTEAEAILNKRIID